MFRPPIPSETTPVIRRRSPGRCAPCLLVFLGLIGMACGRDEGPELAPVSGTVTYKGKPVTEGIVSFQPVSPDGSPATRRG